MDRRYLPKLITAEDWLAKAHPKAPALPWRGDQGEEICSFAVVPLNESAGIIIVLFDAYGREVVRHGDARAILVTCLSLNSTLWELTFLPQASSVKAGATAETFSEPAAAASIPGNGEEANPRPRLQAVKGLRPQSFAARGGATHQDEERRPGARSSGGGKGGAKETNEGG
jgi:hypothetical protein